MPNLRDHASEAGEWTLDERPFDELDALFLGQCVYLPLEGLLQEDASCTLGEAADFLEANLDPETLDIFQKKRFALLTGCAHLPRWESWVLSGYVNRIDDEQEMQFCACTCALSDGQRCVAFRGTDLTVTGWKEDLNLAVMTVPAQREAKRYVTAAADGGSGSLLLCGHSKGGNLAVYAAASAEERIQARIRRVYTFDGPGLEEELLEDEGYRRVASRIESFIPQSSVVGLLLEYHPAYTVVRSTALGILQHDAMTWQIQKGSFVRLESVDLSAKVAEEALHTWLAQMDLNERRRLIDAIRRVVDAARADLVTDFVSDWKGTNLRMRQAFRALPVDEKRCLLARGKALLSTGAYELVRTLVELVTRRDGEDEAPG